MSFIAFFIVVQVHFGIGWWDRFMMLIVIKRLQRGMCKHFCDTQQVPPCKLNHGIPDTDGHSRTCTGNVISSM